MSDSAREVNYLSLLNQLDKKGEVPYLRTDEVDIELSDILLKSHPSTDVACRTEALQAINAFYSKRPITLGGLAKFYFEFKKTEEGRATLALDATMTALTCQTVAAVSVGVGVYELAAAFFVAGTYKAYEVFDLARKN